MRLHPKIAPCATARMAATILPFSKNDHPYCVNNAIHPQDTHQRPIPAI